MKEDLRRLIEIQRIDDEIAAENERQGILQEELEEDRAIVREAENQLENDRQELLELRKQIDRKTLSVKEKEEDIEKDKNTLAKITSNKEYKAILAQVEKDRADLSVAEDGVLDAMSRSDEVGEDLKAVENTVKEKGAVLAAKESEADKQMNSSREHISSLESEKTAVTNDVDAEFIEIYTKLAGRVDGRVIVHSDGGMCGGCNITLTPQTISKLIGGEEIIRCMSCGRIIYLQDEQSEK